MRRTVCAAIAATTAFHHHAMAQQPLELEEIVVSGGLAPVDARSYARAATVIDGAEIERRGVGLIADALRQTPGLTVSRAGGAGGETVIRIRGAEANHVLVLIDGVETANSSEAFDFSTLTADHVERVEVLRGPQAAVYGAGATAGVINVITRGGVREGTALSARVEGGTAPSFAASALAQGGTARADAGLSVAWRDDEGWNTAGDGGAKDGLENLTVNLRADADPTETLSLRGSIRFTDRENEFDQFNFGCGDRDCLVTDAPNRIEGDDLSIGVGAEHRLFGGRVTQSPSLGFSRETNDVFDTFGDADDRASTLRAGYQLGATFGPDEAHAVIGAVQFRRERFASSFLGDDSKARNQIGYVGDYRGQITDRLFAQAGVRFDDNDEFEDFTSWSLSASYALPETATRLRASVGRAQTNPTFFEQFGFIPGSFVGNPDLRPEKNFGWDVGVDQDLWGGRARLEATWFDETLEDEIVGFGTTVDNLDGESDREGLELALSLEPVDGLRLRAAYTFLNASEPDGSQEVRRPRHQAGANVMWSLPDGRTRLGADVTWTGETAQRDFSDPSFASPKIRVASWLRVDLTAAYAVTDRVEAYASVENLLDRDYQEVFGFEARPLTGLFGLRARF